MQQELFNYNFLDNKSKPKIFIKNVLTYKFNSLSL